MKKGIYFALMFLPLVIAVIALPFMPEQIPAHYNFAGEIDRWGSKFETLFFPVATIAMGFFMLWMAKIAKKDEENGNNNEKIVFYTGMGILIWFTVQHCYSIYKSFVLAENPEVTSGDVNQLICILLGIGMVIIGNFMPKLRNNGMIGLRTPWSMKNDTTWKKSQIFGGISFMVCGALIVAAGLFLEGYAAMGTALGLIIADTIICVIYTYKIARKY